MAKISGVHVNTVAFIKDVKTSGTAGGTLTGGVYQTRTLNTLEDPSGVVTSLVANQFTLGAGIYEIDFSAPAYSGTNNLLQLHKVKIQNITDAVAAILGSSEYNERIAGGGVATNRSGGKGKITITSTKTFELQHRCATTMTTTGAGVNTSFGDDEVYAIVKITKLG